MALREFDLVTRRFVTDGFNLAEAKGGADWLDRDTVLLSSASQGVTSSGYANSVRLWQRGEAPGAPVFEVDPTSMVASGQYERADDRLVFIEYKDFFNTTVSIGDRTGPKQRIDLPSDCRPCLGAWLDGDQAAPTMGRG